MCALPVGKPTSKQPIYENIKPVYMMEYAILVPSARNLLYKNHTEIDMNNNVLESTTAAMTVIKISQVYNS